MLENWNTKHKLERPLLPKCCHLLFAHWIFCKWSANVSALSFEFTSTPAHPCTLVEERPPLWDELPVNCGAIKRDEVEVTVETLKFEKACGVDEISPE